MDSTIKGLFEMIRDNLNHGGDKTAALTALKTIFDSFEAISTPVEGAEWPLGDLIECVTREIGMRRRVYGRKVHQGNMSQHKMDSEIQQMTDVLDILKGLYSVFIGPDLLDNQATLDFDASQDDRILTKIKGQASSRRVWINGKELLPAASQRVWNHSPDGFSWGYAGSGPAQLALAIVMELVDEDTAKAFHQKFKFDILAPLHIERDFDIEIDINEWVSEARKGVVGK